MGVVLFASIPSDYLSAGTYALLGLMLIWMLEYLYMYREEKRGYYLICAGILAVASIFTSRAGIVMIISLAVASIIMRIVVFIYNKGNGTLLALLVCIMATAIYVGRKKLIDGDGFRRDVLNTFLKSLFTTHRYSFGRAIGIPVLGVLIISVLLFLIFSRKNLKALREIMLITIGSVVYIAFLCGLYVLKFAYENIQQGEYLTGFENYVLIPVIMTMCFWGKSLFFRIYKEGRSR
jgi:hypothetical protein